LALNRFTFLQSPPVPTGNARPRRVADLMNASLLVADEDADRPRGGGLAEDRPRHFFDGFT
jgi:hypothetical protein